MTPIKSQKKPSNFKDRENNPYSLVLRDLLILQCCHFTPNASITTVATSVTDRSDNQLATDTTYAKRNLKKLTGEGYLSESKCGTRYTATPKGEDALDKWKAALNYQPPAFNDTYRGG